jgi:hypothetical protein
MVVLNEQPGVQEWLALGLVVLALFIVLFQPAGTRAVPPTPPAPED